MNLIVLTQITRVKIMFDKMKYYIGQRIVVLDVASSPNEERELRLLKIVSHRLINHKSVAVSYVAVDLAGTVYYSTPDVTEENGNCISLLCFMSASTKNVKQIRSYHDAEDVLNLLRTRIERNKTIGNERKVSKAWIGRGALLDTINYCQKSIDSIITAIHQNFGDDYTVIIENVLENTDRFRTYVVRQNGVEPPEIITCESEGGDEQVEME